MRQVVSRLNKIELRLVLVVVSGNVLLRDIDLGSNFLVQDLLRGQGSPDIMTKIVNRQFAFAQALRKFPGAVW